MTHNIETAAYPGATDLLIDAIQKLSLARTLPAVMAIVRHTARALTGADGATFVLRDNDMCYYADEDAIAPLWKGNRFPMSVCISGWVMLNKQPVIIEDIYADSRIPVDAYRPTFVKSLAMVPIRTDSPVGAIGNYWATPHKATLEELRLLQALANSTSIAMENIQLYNELEQRVQDRTLQLEVANKELRAFSYSVSHDLQSPVRAISGFCQAIADELPSGLPGDARRYLDKVQTAAVRMDQLIKDLLHLSHVSREELTRQQFDFSELAKLVIGELRGRVHDRKVDASVSDGISVNGDSRLIQVVLENLLGNAWKFTSKQAAPRVEVGSFIDGDRAVYYVRDNGAGFDMAHAAKLFEPFQRLHSTSEFPGTGVGLATVQRIIHKHGGRIWIESAPGQGTTVFFTLT